MFFSPSLSSEFNSRKSYTRKQIREMYKTQTPSTLFEWLDSNEYAKPYFDIDRDFEYKQDDLNEFQKQTDTMAHVAKQELCKLFGREFGSLNIAYESSSGNQECHKHGKVYKSKLSIHLVIQDFLIQGNYLKKLLLDNKLDDEQPDGLFDMSVYRKGSSKFRLAGFKKTPDSTRPSIIHDKAKVTSFIITNTKGIEEKFGETIQSPKSIKSSITKKQNIKTAFTKQPMANSIMENLPEYQEISDLLNIIGVLDKRDKWLKVTMAIKNTNEAYFALWDKWSKQSSSYDEYQNTQTWNSLQLNGGLRLGTLHYLAKQANPDAYFKLYHFGIMEQYVHQNEYGIAMIFAGVFENYIKCVDQKSSLFFVYDHTSALWIEKPLDCLQSFLIEKLNPLFHRYIRFKDKDSDKVTKADLEKIEEITKVAGKLTTSTFIKKVLSILKGFESIKDEDFRNKLISKKDLLSVRNGVVDLRTGELRARNYDDYLTTYLDIKYDPDAYNDEWEQFIGDLFDHKDITDPDAVVEYLQAFYGYSITGHTNQQIMAIFYGGGSNGKTLLANIIKEVFSKYTETVKSEILDKRVKTNNANAASPELSKLYGKRIAIINESDEGMVLGKEMKSLVDSSTITARELYGKPFTMELTSQFMLYTNDLPKFPAENCYTRRIRAVPFLNTYKDADKMGEDDKLIDRQLEGKLLKNKAGILRWFVKGAVKYYELGKKLPDEPVDLEKAKSCYVLANDWTSAFTVTKNKKDFIPAREIKGIIFENYGIWVDGKTIKDGIEKLGAKSQRTSGDRGFCFLKSIHYHEGEGDDDSDNED